MTNVIHLPPSGNPYLANPVGAPLDLAEAEQAAFLTFGCCRAVFEKTGTTPDQIKLFEARTTWDRLYRRILLEFAPSATASDEWHLR